MEVVKMELVAFFDWFLENEVNLNKSRLDKLNEKTQTVDTFFKNNEKFKSFYIEFKPQGSYAQKTIIKPPKDKDFDADLLILLKRIKNWNPKNYIEEIYNEFYNDDNYKRIVEKSTHCVTLNYKSDFHIDLVPFVEVEGLFQIANGETDNWEKSNPIEFTKWINSKNEKANGQLILVIRLFKYLRDVKGNFSVKSILMNTLIGNCVNESEGYGYFRNLTVSFMTIFSRLNEYLQSNTNMPVIKNPTLADENFCRDWDQSKYTNFREKMNKYYLKSKEAQDADNKESSIALWKAVFGDAFPEAVQNDRVSSMLTPIASQSKPWSY
jgi:hypothetical protein